MKDEEEIAQFEAAMSEEELDTEGESAQLDGSATDLADPAEGEAGDDAGEELSAEGAEYGESEEGMAAGSESPRFEVPEEFGGSIHKWAEAQREARERAEAAAAQHKERAVYYEHLARQQAAQFQQAAPQPQGLIQPTRDVLLAAAVQGSPEAFAQFPEEIQQQAKAYNYQQRAIQEQFWANPQAQIQQAAEVLFQQRVAPIEAELRQMRAQRFRDQHPDVLGTPEGRAEFLEASNKSQLDLVLENLKLKRALEKAARSNKDEQRKEQDKQARRTAQRGTDRRPQQRAGRAQPKLSSDQAANPKAVGEAILREHGLA